MILEHSNTLKARGRAVSKSVHKGVHEVCYAWEGKRSPWENRPSTSLRTSEVKALIHSLSLPLSTPMIATKIADLGKTLTRGEMSLTPRELCVSHTWFEPKYLHTMAELISSELWERSEGLYAFPESSLNADIKQMLYKTLVEYKAIFRVKPQKSSVEFIKTPAEAWKDGKKGSNRADNCLACDLSRFIRDKKAVDAICTLCKGRKKKGYTWPELLAFLSPVEYGKNENWRREFIKSSRHVTRMRRKINVWRDCGGDAWINDLRKAQEWDQGEEVPIVYSLTRDSELRDMGYSPPLSGETLHNAAEDSPKNDPFDDEGEEVPFSLPPKTPAKHDNPRPPSSQHHHSTTSKHTSDARSSRAPSVSHSKHSSRPSRSSSVSHHSRHQQEELLTPKVFDPHRSSHKSHTSSHAPSSHPSRTESVAHSKHSSHSSRHSTSSRTSRASSVSHASGYPQPDLLTPANLRRHESTLLSEVSGHTITPRRAEPKAPMRKSCAAESKRERASTVSTSVAYRALHGEYV